MTLEPLAAIIAGGAGKRMGTDKAAVVVADRTMLEHVLTAVHGAGVEAIVVGRGEVPDLRPAYRGPLAGIEAALTAAQGRPLVVFGVDQPWLRPETVRRLAGSGRGGDALVPEDDGRAQVTCARYGPACLAAASTLLDTGPRPVTHLLAMVRTEMVPKDEWTRWGEDGRSWFSVDREADIAVGLDRYGPPGTLPP